MVAQPYLYSAVETAQNGNNLPYSEFNPKAVTEAHYAAFQERADRNKRKNATQDHRPLINFNQHPDSYVVVANPTVHHEPLPENTKKLIVWTRWVQLVFRVFQELGALGLLVCVICLKMKSDGPGWIIRVAVRWRDGMVSVFAQGLTVNSRLGMWSSPCTPFTISCGPPKDEPQTVAGAITSSHCSWIPA
jgi:hypothetical protein